MKDKNIYSKRMKIFMNFIDYELKFWKDMQISFQHLAILFEVKHLATGCGCLDVRCIDIISQTKLITNFIISVHCDKGYVNK